MARMTLEGNRMSGMLAVANRQFVLAQTLGGTLTMAADLPNVLVIDPGGANRTVLLPAESAGLWFQIYNSADAIEYLNVFEDSGVTLMGAIAPGGSQTFRCDGSTWRVNDGAQNAAAVLGAINAPSSGTLAAIVFMQYPYWRIDFTLTLLRITVTDAAGSGSSGSQKLWDLVQGAWTVLGCRQDYTAFAEGAALTTAAGDAAFVMGLGTVAANAGDAALTSTEVDIGAVTGTITNSGGTGAGTQVSGALGAFNGTATASDILLNWSGSAATIDANSTIDVTGTISVAGVWLGDD